MTFEEYLEKEYKVWEFKPDSAFKRDQILGIKSNPEIDTIFKKGDEYLQKGETQKAFREYSKAFAIDSSNLFVNLKLAQVMVEEQKEDSAILYCDNVLWHNPEFPNAYILRGMIYLNFNNYKKAYKDFDKVVSKYPNFNLGYYYRGLANFYMGKYISALSDIDDALALNPNHLESYFLRAEIKLCSDDTKGALEDYKKIIQLDKNNYLAFINKGRINLVLKKYFVSNIAFSKAIKLQPDIPLGYICRAISNLLLEDYQSAKSDYLTYQSLVKNSSEGKDNDPKIKFRKKIEFYNKAIRIDSSFGLGYAQRGYIWERLDSFNMAISDYNKAIEVDPEAAMAYNRRGDYYRRNGNIDQAWNDINKAIKLSPNYVDAITNLGLLNMRKYQYDTALVNFSKAIELNGSYSKAYCGRGMVKIRQNNYRAAKEDFDKAISLNKSYPDAYSGRAYCLYKLGDRIGMISDFRSLNQLNSYSVDRYFLLGLYNRDDKNYEAAIENLNQADKLDSNNREIIESRASVYFRKGMLQDAINEYRKALVIDSLKITNFNNLTEVYIENSQFDSASYCIQKLLSKTDDLRMRLIATFLSYCIKRLTRGDYDIESKEINRYYSDMKNNKLKIKWNFQHFKAWLVNTNYDDQTKNDILSKIELLEMLK
jgi:tetratricopeptide (TPR) repeat protein